MKLILGVLFAIYSFLVLSPSFYAEKEAGKWLKKSFRDSAFTLEEMVFLNSDTISSAGLPVRVYKVHLGNDEFYYAVFTQAMGRFDLFDYMVLINKQFTVMEVVVLQYRSEHGFEIASKKWLKQFAGYDGRELKYGKDISAISGATISASSLTKNIPELWGKLRNLLDN